MDSTKDLPYYDAHCHLSDGRLAHTLEEQVQRLEAGGVRRVVVNGTSEEDWPEVERLAERYAFITPSFGLHPWFVGKASGDWREQLERFCRRHPSSGVGEIGLDRWIEDHDIVAQAEAFLWQMELATTLNRPVTIHCLQAWGKLLELLREAKIPSRGFLLHSYGGSIEMAQQLANLGGRFSLSGYFAHERKEKQRQAFLSLPRDRLLIESDAPDMVGPSSVVACPLSDENGKEINAPVNLFKIYEFAAALFEEPLAVFAERVQRNFQTFFGES